MTIERRDHPVVVAVGEDSNGRALTWAAAEAAARRSPLCVVHVMQPHWAVDSSGLVPVSGLSIDREAAEDTLRAAVDEARSVASDMEISAELVVGSTVSALVAQSRAAQLLVLGGARAVRARRFGGLVVRGVGGRVAARSRCPVVVVRRLASGPSHGVMPHVVVGVDGSGSCREALPFAFSAASQRGLPLTAVHAWSPDRPADLEAVSGPVAASAASARRILDQALVPWRRQFVDVTVEARLVCDDPAPALIRESVGAALTVVGSRPRGSAGFRVFGSVSWTVTQQAHCPAVVVPPDRAVVERQARPGGRSVVPTADPMAPEPDPRRRTRSE